MASTTESGSSYRPQPEAKIFNDSHIENGFIITDVFVPSTQSRLVTEEFPPVNDVRGFSKTVTLGEDGKPDGVNVLERYDKSYREFLVVHKEDKAPVIVFLEKRQSIFKTAQAEYGPDGSLASIKIDITLKNAERYDKPAFTRGEMPNEFETHTPEDNFADLMELVRLHGGHVLLGHMYKTKDIEKALSEVQKEERKKVHGWSERDRARVFTHLLTHSGDIIDRYLGDYDLDYEDDLRPFATYLTLQASLFLPDSFPSFPDTMKNDPQFYESILNIAASYLLKLYHETDKRKEVAQGGHFTVAFNRVADSFEAQIYTNPAKRVSLGVLADGAVLEFDGFEYMVCQTEQGTEIAFRNKKEGVYLNFPTIDMASAVQNADTEDQQIWKAQHQLMSPKLETVLL